MLSKRARPKPPIAVWVYLLGTVALVGFGVVPSRVQTSYSLQGSLIEIALLVGLLLGVNVCRWCLIVVGVLAGIGIMLVQASPPELVPTLWSVLALAMTALLFLPSTRRYTGRPRGRTADW